MSLDNYDLRAYDRLFDRTEVKENGCIEFTGAQNPKGYGQFFYRGRMDKAHRIAYHLCISTIPNDLWVLHKCDNPPCVNPEHLFIGTAADNNDDMYQKGRHGFKAHIGIKHGRAKLTEDDVKNIRLLYEQGKSQQRIAEIYNMGQSQIGRIIRKEEWSHVD